MPRWRSCRETPECARRGPPSSGLHQNRWHGRDRRPAARRRRARPCGYVPHPDFITGIPERQARRRKAHCAHDHETGAWPPAARTTDHALHGRDLLQGPPRRERSHGQGVSRVQCVPCLCRSTAGKVSIWRGETDLRTLPDPLLQASTTRAGTDDHAVCRSAHGLAASLAKPYAPARQVAAS
jgi:hypothetical protein